MKIYLAGKVTGLPKEKVIEKFTDLKTNLQQFGFEVINPIEVVENWDTTWENAMKKCIKALVDCDAVYLMDCHKQSLGALVELELANRLNIPCVTNVFSLIEFREKL